MEYFLFGGANDVGKTEAINHITDDLLKTGRFYVINGAFPQTKNQDFLILLDGSDIHGNKKKIIINSSADDETNIEALDDYIKNNGACDLVISAIQCDTHPIRNYFIKQLSININNIIEIPMATITDHHGQPVQIRQWYHSKLNDIVHRLLHFKYNLF
jgi:hypothetical protein